jgi:hypothetical protein
MIKSPLIFLLVTLDGSGLVTQQSIFSAYGSENPVSSSEAESGYKKGYDRGCEDASVSAYSPPPDFTTDVFQQGYEDGFNSCSNFDAETPQPPSSQEPFQTGREGGDGGQPDEAQPYQEPYYPPPQSGGINWENLCNQYGHLVGIKDPCYEYASGTQLPEKGKTALVCLLGGGITLLASLDPATKAEIIALGQQYCP